MILRQSVHNILLEANDSCIKKRGVTNRDSTSRGIGGPVAHGRAHLLTGPWSLGAGQLTSPVMAMNSWHFFKTILITG